MGSTARAAAKKIMDQTNSAMPSFKQFEHTGWELVADKYHQYFENLTRQTIPALLEAVNARKGLNLIDVACGPGYVAEAGFSRGCTVTGVDFSATMIERASALFPEISFVEGDAENLKFADASFDALTMNFGILHLEHPEQALKESYRVLKPGGVAAMTVWAPPEQSAGFRCVLKNIEKYGGAVELPQGPAFFRFSNEQEFERCLESAGFTKIEFRSVKMLWRLPDGEALFNAFCQGTPRTGGTLRAQPSDKLEAIKKGVIESTQEYRTNDGLEIPMESLLAMAS